MANEQLGTDFYFEVDFTTDSTNNEYGTEANYKAIACSTNSGYSGSNAPLDVSNKCTGGYGASLPGQGSFTFSFDGQQTILLGAEEDIKVTNQELAMAQNEKQVFFARVRTLDNKIYREGKVMIPDYSESYPNAEVATFTATFNGIGKPRLVAPVLVP